MNEDVIGKDLRHDKRSEDRRRWLSQRGAHYGRRCDSHFLALAQQSLAI
jgi:hypothetical protein